MNKSLFILGAGASKDFSDIFPLGLELIKEINYHFITEENIPEENSYYLSALMNVITNVVGNGTNAHIDQFKKIKKALWKMQADYEWKYLRKNNTIPLSIDSFVSKQMNTESFNIVDVDVIKCCIYYLIKGFEQAKAEQRGFGNDWIYNLASKVSESESHDIINSVSIVTFNYDRIFENQFCNYLLSGRVFNAEDNEVFQKNNVLHVYGSLGSLNEVPFESKNDDLEKIKKFYKNIQLIDKTSKTIPISFEKAETFRSVHFIGFGYDEDNLEILDLKQFKSATFYGTAYNSSAQQRAKIRDRIPGIDLHNVTCAEYMNNLIF